MNEDLKKLQSIIADVLNVDPEEITAETTFEDDLGADSLDMYQILMGIEEEYGITIPEEKANEFGSQIKNVADILELIRNAKGEEE